ncbi:hypothetical protein E4T56_gene6594, partial [Termitomyces sp. T112]
MPIFQLKYTSTELTTMPNFEILYDNICLGSTISIHLSQARESLSCVVKLERNDDQPILNQTQELIVVDEPPSTTPAWAARNLDLLVTDRIAFRALSTAGEFEFERLVDRIDFGDFPSVVHLFLG